MRLFSHPRFKAYAGAFCVLCCVAKVVALVLGGSAAVSAISAVDFRLPLILAGWSCIGVAAYLMHRTRRELSAPACCPVRKRAD